MASRDRFADGSTPDGTAAASGNAAAGDEAAPGGEPAAAASQPGGLEIYGDSAYGAGDARAAYRDAGLDMVIKPKPVRPAVPGGFLIDDFTVDEDEGTVACPAGVTSIMTANRTVTFGAACAGCPLRDQCTTAKGGRSMTIHPHEDLLRAAAPGPAPPSSGRPTRW